MSEESLLAERTQQSFNARDEAEKREQVRRRAEWEEVESGAGMRRMPADKQRSHMSSAIGGVCPFLVPIDDGGLTDSPRQLHLLPSGHLDLFQDLLLSLLYRELRMLRERLVKSLLSLERRKRRRTAQGLLLRVASVMTGRINSILG